MKKRYIHTVVEIANNGALLCMACERAGLRSADLKSMVQDVVSHGVELINPSTVAHAKALPVILQEDGLFHVLTMEERRRGVLGWSDWYQESLTEYENLASGILADPTVKTIDDVTRRIIETVDRSA